MVKVITGRFLTQAFKQGSFLVNFRTSFEQRGSISVNGVGSLIGGMMEAFGQTFLQRGANKVTLSQHFITSYN